MIQKLRRKLMLLVAMVLVLVSAGIVISINLTNWHYVESQAKSVLEKIAESDAFIPTMEHMIGSDSSSSVTTVGTAEISLVSLVYDPEPAGDMPAGDMPAGDMPAADMSTADMSTAGESMEPPGFEDRPELQKPEELSPQILQRENHPEENNLEENHPEDNSETPEKPLSQGQPKETEGTKANLSNYYVVYFNEDGTIEGWGSDKDELYSDEQVSEMTAIALAAEKEYGYVGTQFYKFVEQDGQNLLIVLDNRLAVANAKSVLQTTIIIALSSCILLSGAAWFLICKILKPVQESFDKQKQFIWDASHELKTPLAVIRANADVLEMEIGENENLSYIQSEVKRTDLLVRDLLTLARMDHGKLTADIKKINLSEAVLSVALPLESKIYEDKKQFDIQVDEHTFCLGDGEMLKQLTVILLSNALKYSDARGRISLSVSRKGNCAELCVGNSGPGISAKDQERIFERFYRADTSRNRNVEGFGVGLSIAKKIIELHQGKIRVFSVPGKWTEFRIYLPV